VKKKAHSVEEIMAFARKFDQVSRICMVREHMRRHRWVLEVGTTPNTWGVWEQANGGSEPPKWMLDAVVKLRALAVSKGWTEREDRSGGKTRAWIYDPQKQGEMFK